MRNTTAWLMVALLLGAPGAVRADLDVGIPPGAPGDWLRTLPEPGLTGTWVVPVKVEQARGSVTVVPRTEYTVPGGVLGFSGLTALDTPLHVTWTLPAVKLRTVHAPGAAVWKLEYPPPKSAHLTWLGISLILRTALHPAQVSSVATAEHLVLLGPAGYEAAGLAQRHRALKGLAVKLSRDIGDVPSARPLPKLGKSAYESMLLRLAIAELAGGHPYTPERPFATRLRGLGAEVRGPLLTLSHHSHELIRRNAVSLLANFTTPAVTSRLRELLSDRDKVVRNRALQALIDRRDRGATAALSKILSRSDRGLAILAADGLGRCGDQAAIEPLKRYAKRRGKDPDALMATLPALARLVDSKAPDEALRQLMRNYYFRYARFIDSFPSAPPPWDVDHPDPRTRAQVVAQMCILVLAAMGDEKAQDKGLTKIHTPDTTTLEKLTELGRRVMAAGPALRSFEVRIGRASGGFRAQLVAERDKLRAEIDPLRKELRQRVAAQPGGKSSTAGLVLVDVAPPSRFVVCEVLPILGKPGHEILKKVVSDPTEYGSLRVHALDKLDLTKVLEPAAVPAWLENLAAAATSALVRARALRRLGRVDKPRAVEVARKIVAAYLTRPVESLPGQHEWDVIPALRLLGRAESPDPRLFTEVARFASKERAEARAQQKEAAAAPRPKGLVERIPDQRIFVLPPILEVALLALGRTGAAGLPVLTARLDQPTALARPQCALALGGIGGKLATARLVKLLGDEDPGTRLGAYLALRQLSGEDHSCDWLFGDAKSRENATLQWEVWAARQE